MFAGRECAASPLYRELALAVAGDPDLLALASTATHGPVPNLFLAAVHDLLMRSPEAELARYYATLVRDPRRPAGAGRIMRSFALDQRDAIEALLRSRLVQTNEVRRALPLYLALNWLVAREDLRRIALIEIGCSAGLLLTVDRYAYHPGGAVAFGNRESALTIAASIHGQPPINDAVRGRIAERIGIDLNTLDLDDPEDHRWLRALVWGDQPERLALLDRAIAAARAVSMTLLEGDGNRLLPGVLSGLDAGLAPVIFHSHALNQFPADAREQFSTILAATSASRPVYRIAMEYDETGPRVEISIYRDGRLDECRTLARYDAHGASVAWLGDSGDL